MRNKNCKTKFYEAFRGLLNVEMPFLIYFVKQPASLCCVSYLTNVIFTSLKEQPLLKNKKNKSLGEIKKWIAHPEIAAKKSADWKHLHPLFKPVFLQRKISFAIVISTFKQSYQAQVEPCSYKADSP